MVLGEGGLESSFGFKGCEFLGGDGGDLLGF